MSEWELLGYEANLPRMEARRVRRQLTWPPGCRPTVDQIYELILAETGDERQANAAAGKYAASALRNNNDDLI